MKIKVKNISNKEKKLKLLNDEIVIIKSNQELIIGDYSEESRSYIFNLLKKGFEVSKVEDDYIIKSEGSGMSSEESLEETNKDNNQLEEKSKKKRGRPRKNI